MQYMTIVQFGVYRSFTAENGEDALITWIEKADVYGRRK